MKTPIKLKNVIVLILISVLFAGCSDDSNESLDSLLKDKETSLMAQEKLKELLIMTEGNYTQLACILNVSPSTLKRLYRGETFATPVAEKEINKHYNYFLVERNSVEDYKAECISYAWYHHVEWFMSNWWFWIAVVGFALYLLVVGDGELTGFAFGFIGFFAIVYGIIWIINYFGGTPDYGAVQDNFVNTLNTVWETQI